MNAPPRRGRRRLLLRVIQMALVAAAAYFIVRYLADSWTAVTDYEWRLRPAWLAASAALFLAYFLLNGLGWWLILRGCGLAAGRSRAIATWGASILARYVPGTVWMFAGRLWMSREQGLEAERVSAAMVYEQALGVAAALLTTALLFPFWDWQRGVTALAMLAIPVIVGLLHPRPFARLAGWVLCLLRRPPLAQVLPFRLVLGLLAYFVVIWLVGGLACWTLAAAVTEVTAAALPAATAAFAFAYVAGMVAFFVPSGIGVREGVIAAGMASTLPGGVALAFAVLLRLWQTVIELAFVGAVTAYERVAGKRP